LIDRAALFDVQVLPDGIFRLEMVWDYSNDEGEILADRWHKKIGSFEAVADDVLMGESARSITRCTLESNDKNFPLYNQV